MEATVMAERAPAAPKLKAKASNSIFAFPGRGTSSAARRFRDILTGLLADMGSPSEADLCHAVKLQLRNTAFLAVQIEASQALAMAGKPVDLVVLVRQQNLLARGLWGLSLGKRRRENLGPQKALDTYLATKVTA